MPNNPLVLTPNGVPPTRRINTTSPLAGGGNLFSDLNLTFTPTPIPTLEQVTTAGATTDQVITALGFSGPLTGHASLDLPLTGGTLTGNLTAPTFIGAVTGHASLDLPLTGGTLTGPITINPPSQGGIGVYSTTVTPTIQVGYDATHNFQLYWFGGIGGAGYFGTFGNAAPLNFSGSAVNFTSVATFSSNVGIGTAPSYPLDVLTSGNASARFSSTGAANRVTIDHTSGDPNTGFGLSANGITKWSNAMYRYLGAGHNYDYVLYDDEQGRPGLLIQGDTGNVGIGTTNPIGRLDIRATDNGIALLLLNFAGASYLRGGSVSADIHFGDILTRNVLIGELGGVNVGIGTANPSYSLDVRGLISANDGTTKAFLSYIAGTEGQFGTLSNHPLCLYTNGTKRATLNTSGNLDVTGSVTATAYAGQGISPVGAVIAWLKSMTGTPSLPAGWVECNGQTLSDAGSVYNGQVIPDLNGSLSGQPRFLRGDTTSNGFGGSDTLSFTPILDLSTADTTFGGATGEFGINIEPVLVGCIPAFCTVVWILRVK